MPVSLKPTLLSKILIFSSILYIILHPAIAVGQWNNTFFHELNASGIPFNKRVNTLYEDSFGFLWIGTNTGLYCYDGHTLKPFKFNVFDDNSIPNNTINSIVEDSDKNLWIGTESFLVFFDRRYEQFRNYHRDSYTRCMIEGNDGTIWGTISRTGIFRINPADSKDKATFETRFQHIIPSGTNKNEINALYEDNFGRQWVATSKGVSLLGPDFQQRSTGFQKDTRLIIAGGNNTLLVATNAGIYRLGYTKSADHLEVLESYTDFLSPHKPQVDITSMTIDNNSTLWVGTNHGLYQGRRINNRYKWGLFSKHEQTEGSLLSNRISSLVVDRFGNLWIGSGRGVNKLTDRNSFYQFLPIDEKVPSIPNHSVNSILKEGPNVLWVGTNSGVYKYNLKRNTYHKLSHLNHRVTCIRPNYKRDGLLIGSYRNLYEVKKHRTAALQVTLVKNEYAGVMDIVQINDNETWLGLWVGGIDIINNTNKLSPFKKQLIARLKNCHVSTLLYDSHGSLWIGTRGKGLFRVDLLNETFDEIKPSRKSGLYSNAILCLREDKNGNIWIGTRGGGLSFFDHKDQRFITFTEKDGLPSSTVSSIEIASNGSTWISTGNGLAVYNHENQVFTSFGVSDGVIESDFKYNSSTSGIAGDYLFFGGTNGVHQIKNKAYKRKRLLPLTIISSFKLLAQTPPKGSEESVIKEKSIYVSPLGSGSIVIPYSQNNISISFSSLDLTSPGKNEYAYRLKEVKDYWTYTTAENRYANYNDLAPGSYTFEVKSSNSDGVWNHDPAIVTFTVEPPYWRTGWAYLIYTILILAMLTVAIVLSIRWYQLKQNLLKETISHEKDKQHHQMKMVYFTDISHELRTPLTLVQGTIEKVIREKNYKLGPITAQRIFNNSKRMNRLIDQIMDIRKHDVGEFKLAVKKQDVIAGIHKIKNAFNDLAHMHDIEYLLKSHHTMIRAWFDFEVLEKILFNLLSNAFKYTPEKGKIEIKVEEVTDHKIIATESSLKKGQYMKCTVRDNGIGIPEADLPYIFDRYYQSTKLPTHQVPGTGIGMELVQKLVELHYGTISVTSVENEFSEFIFYLPIEKEHYKKKERQKHQKNYESDQVLHRPDESLETLTTSAYNGKRNAAKILIVEDNKEVQQMVSEELAVDYHIITAVNGAEGFETACIEKPDLIISDILMPVEDGVSLLKKLKQQPDLKHTPVFMLTARDSEEVRIQCTGLGADDFIEKPFSLEFLKWKVRNTLVTRRELKEKYSRVITAEPSMVNEESHDEKFIRRLVTIIESSIDDHLLSVEYLASEAGMSRANLYRKVQQILKETPVNLIKQIRLKRAAQLMQDGSLYISEIAYMTGFKNQKYFSRCFQKHYDMSPTEFMKGVQNQQNVKEEIRTNLLEDIIR
ncbi:response regulator [Fulvivirga sp. M361]|uniref:hybrid sensor histidine kinase/response regulator transcription factor n=1 Tax=Fulvivirga sp. M361 TaxID=2594266 RepID=UPI00117B30D3|nr:hybrid sensor histidine kinase/response regulator transcription factor [Fulvivirga sp. M361]TRX59167.1 response regulator [Fulvivirga sp. M361]